MCCRGQMFTWRGREGAGGFPAEVGALLGLEKTILRRMRPTLCDRAPATAHEPARDAGQKPDVVIDLTGAIAAGRAPGAALWRVLYDNAPGEAAAVAALLGGACPSLALRAPRRRRNSGRGFALARSRRRSDRRPGGGVFAGHFPDRTGVAVRRAAPKNARRPGRRWDAARRPFSRAPWPTKPCDGFIICPAIRRIGASAGASTTAPACWRPGF